MRNHFFAITLLFALTLPAAAQDWGGAKWIWDAPEANKVAQDDSPRCIRLTFTLDAKPISAELWVTVDNWYTAHVNAKKVGEDDEWATVEKYDVAKHLVVGKNVVAILAQNKGGVAGAIARLHIKTADKKDLYVVTNEKTPILRNSPRDDFREIDYDDRFWKLANVLGDPDIGPWNLEQAKVKGKKGGGQFGYDTNETVAVKGRLTPEEQVKHFVVPKDFAIELVAADPVIINPITMVMDGKGRIIVSESHTYRYGPPGSPIKPYANPVVRLDPDGKGGFTRTLIADGFADPVMGIAVKGDKLWLTANNYLYTYDLPEKAGEESKSLATNKKAIVTDLNKAWNPFGMFVLEWGPDGKLYMSVGNHNISLQGPDKDKMSSRGGSGLIVRMEADGSKMERLVHGLRVPYSFEFDPFAQLWLLSNGEGNPNRFVRVIQGVDYHCYSRGAVDNSWLAGNHPLAPPCEELHRGADTQLMRYYGAAYPGEYQGNLFLCNWGAHGFAGPNRGIFRFVPDDRNNIVKREPLVWCKDPHFRPAHIILDQDGSLLIADWYGRDDESDLTGRIWRLKYVGKNAPIVKHKLDAPQWKNADYAISALGSPSHLIREKAVSQLLKHGDANVANLLAEHAAESREPMGAANAMWTLFQMPAWKSLVANGANNSDWRVRRLALDLMLRNREGRKGTGNAELKWNFVKGEKDAAVLVAAASLFDEAIDRLAVLKLALNGGGAADAHLRYQAASELAKHANVAAITDLLASDDANVRLAGLIAIDVACYENTSAKKASLEALAKALENPGKIDHQLLLHVAHLDGDVSIVPGLEKLIARDDVPAATVAKAFLVLKAKAGPGYAVKAQGAGKRFVEAVEKGTLPIKTPADQLVLFEFLESEGPTPFALKQVAGQLQASNKEVRLAAHTLARRFGDKADGVADTLWPGVLNPKTKFDEALDSLSTIARVEKASKKEQWEQLLKHDDPLLRMESVRWFRRFEKQPAFIGLLGHRAADLIQKDSKIREDIETVSKQLSGKTIGKGAPSKDELTKHALEELSKMPAGDHAKRAAMGQQVFERNACTKCHTTATATTPLAPSLKGIAQQKVDYLIESVLFPSKVIKTGWEVEVIELKSGRTFTGLVKEDGNTVRILSLDKDERVAKADIESRSTSKVSVMPDGQEATMSRREFVDLIAYLQTLK